MVCVWVAIHENDGNHENDEHNSESYNQGVECWISGHHGNHENDENHGNPGCKPRVPQTTGLEIPELFLCPRKEETGAPEFIPVEKIMQFLATLSHSLR